MKEVFQRNAAQATYISCLEEQKKEEGAKKETVKASFRLRNFLEKHLLFVTTIAAINHVKTVSDHHSILTLLSKRGA
jgi:hypothetical protein